MLWILQNWKVLALAVLIAALPLGFMAGRHIGDGEGYSRYAAETAAQDRRIELQRKGDDAKLQGMGDYDLCREYLGSRRLPVDSCEQLRGI